MHGRPFAFTIGLKCKPIDTLTRDDPTVTVFRVLQTRVQVRFLEVCGVLGREGGSCSGDADAFGAGCVLCDGGQPAENNQSASKNCIRYGSVPFKVLSFDFGAIVCGCVCLNKTTFFRAA